jgi:protein involved in plasmid replication-relaxation
MVAMRHPSHRNPMNTLLTKNSTIHYNSIMPDKRRRRDRRTPTPKPMRLTERDKAIIYTVQQYRVLRQDQLATLFGLGKSVIQRLFVRLYDHGFLERKFLQILGWNSPTLYVLDRKGAELLRTAYGLDDLVWYNSSKALKPDFLEHTVAINDVRIAITKAAQAVGYDLLKWLGENDLKADYDRVQIRSSSGRIQSVSLIPDSYFVLKTPRGIAHVFLELDRGTETTGRFKTKVQAYQAYFRSGAYEKRYNARSMRVVTVTTGERRLETLKRATEEAGGKRTFWFAPLSGNQ